MWCLVVFQHDCMPSTFPKVKKSYSWKTSSVSKEEVVYLCQHFTQTESHKANIMVESPSKWTSTTPVVETSESIEPNDTDLELNKPPFIGIKARLILLVCVGDMSWHVIKTYIKTMITMNLFFTSQVAQTLFVIYIRDSIALRFEPLKRMYENGSKIALNSTCSKGFK